MKHFMLTLRLMKWGSELKHLKWLQGNFCGQCIQLSTICNISSSLFFSFFSIHYSIFVFSLCIYWQTVRNDSESKVSILSGIWIHTDAEIYFILKRVCPRISCSSSLFVFVSFYLTQGIMGVKNSWPNDDIIPQDLIDLYVQFIIVVVKFIVHIFSFKSASNFSYNFSFSMDSLTTGSPEMLTTTDLQDLSTSSPANQSNSATDVLAAAAAAASVSADEAANVVIARNKSLSKNEATCLTLSHSNVASIWERCRCEAAIGIIWVSQCSFWSRQWGWQQFPRRKPTIFSVILCTW